MIAVVAAVVALIVSRLYLAALAGAASQRAPVVSSEHERNSEWPWLFGGTALLMACSACLVLLAQGAGWRFVPLHQGLFMSVFSYGFVLVLPLVFWGTFGFLWHSKLFGVLVFGATLAVAALDAMWFMASVEVAYRYQGRALLSGLAIANLVGFGAAATLCAVGFAKHSRRPIASAYLLLFVLLSTIAFPAFGPYE